MTKSELEDELFAGVKPELESDGFKRNKKQSWYVKETEGAFFMYQYLVYDYSEMSTGRKYFKVEPHIWIHVKKIEDIFLEHTHIKYEFRHRSYTMGGSVFVLAHPDNVDYCRKHDGTLKYFAAVPQDIPPIVARLRQIYRDFAKGYFERFGSLAGANIALNSFPEQISTHKGMGPHRNIKGLIAAKLVHNPEYERLLSIYGEKMKIASQKEQDTFALVVDNLNKILW